MTTFLSHSHGLLQAPTTTCIHRLHTHTQILAIFTQRPCLKSIHTQGFGQYLAHIFNWLQSCLLRLHKQRDRRTRACTRAKAIISAALVTTLLLSFRAHGLLQAPTTTCIHRLHTHTKLARSCSASRAHRHTALGNTWHTKTHTYAYTYTHTHTLPDCTGFFGTEAKLQEHQEHGPTWRTLRAGAAQEQRKQQQEAQREQEQEQQPEAEGAGGEQEGSRSRSRSKSRSSSRSRSTSRSSSSRNS